MLENIFLLLILFSLFLTTLTLVMVLVEKVRQRKVKEIDLKKYPVSILKPLKGVDDNLEENLRSFFKLDYPKYELVFGLSESDDPAIKIIKKLQVEFPEVQTRLIVDPYMIGYNPKVNNLYNMYPKTSYETIVISDSNIRVKADYLKDMVTKLNQTKVGLVTSTILGVNSYTLGALFENLHWNTFISSSAFTVNNLFKIPVTIGKSMCIRKETFQKIGGFVKFSKYLLEDGLIGQAVQDLGLRTVISLKTIENVNSSWSVKQFISRHIRWNTMRRYLNIGTYAGEILSNQAVMTLLFLSLFPSLDNMILAVLLYALKLTIDFVTYRTLGAKHRLMDIPVIFIKDILMGYIWVYPFFSRTVNWRGHKFNLHAKTRISPVYPEEYEKAMDSQSA